MLFAFYHNILSIVKNLRCYVVYS